MLIVYNTRYYKYIVYAISMIIHLFDVVYHKCSIKYMDMSNVYPSRIDDLINSNIFNEDFRNTNEVDQYNRDVLKFFYTNKSIFYVDSTHMDGHFRV